MDNIDIQEHLTQVIVDACNDALLAGDNRKGADLPLPDLTLEEWDKLLSLAAAHGMLPAFMQVFEGRQVEDKMLRTEILKWYALAQSYRQKFQLRLVTMHELAGMFAEETMDIMFFKGAALAQYYPTPDWRVFSDIDFYLFGKWKEGVKVMEKKGIRNRPYAHHNTEAVHHGILLENHYDFIERTYHRRHIRLDDALKELAAKEGRSLKATFLAVNDWNAYVMTPTMNAIFLVRHMAAHFASETIPLRMLYDWALFLRHDAGRVDWGRVCQLYDDAKLTTFVGVIHQILHAHIGIDIPACPIQPTAGETAERVWQSIVMPPDVNPHKQYTVSYYFYETKTFLNNRWKHHLVYPGESYVLLFFRYAWSVLKRLYVKY